MISLLDLLLALCLPALAWVLLRSADIFRAIVFYIVFGLFMALVWVRLAAVDVALVEAAVGAGLTGALFLAALHRMPPGTGRERRVDGMEERSGGQGLRLPGSSPAGRILFGAMILMLVAITGRALWLQPQGEQPLPQAVRHHLAASGVESPVTAVLLNFRGYDTLLEISVLLLAAIGIWSIRPARVRGLQPLVSPIFIGFVRLVIPLMVIFAGYLLVIGAARPGGAFQAGSVLAAAGILLFLHDRSLYFALPEWVLRLVLGGGLAVFLAVACWPMFSGLAFLQYPPHRAGAFIFLIEAAATISIAACLFVLFVQARPSGPERSGEG